MRTAELKQAWLFKGASPVNPSTSPTITSHLQNRLSQPPISSQGLVGGQNPSPDAPVISGNREQLRYLLQRGTTTTAAEFTTLMSSGGCVATTGEGNNSSSSNNPVGLLTTTSTTAGALATAVATTSLAQQQLQQGVTTSRVWVPGTNSSYKSRHKLGLDLELDVDLKLDLVATHSLLA